MRNNHLYVTFQCIKNLFFIFRILKIRKQIIIEIFFIKVLAFSKYEKAFFFLNK